MASTRCRSRSLAFRAACDDLGSVLIAGRGADRLGPNRRALGERARGLEPDVIVLSKAIGGGLPLAVIVYREGLDVWPPGAHAGTFRGNQLALAARDRR